MGHRTPRRCTVVDWRSSLTGTGDWTGSVATLCRQGADPRAELQRHDQHGHPAGAAGLPPHRHAGRPRGRRRSLRLLCRKGKQDCAPSALSYGRDSKRTRRPSASAARSSSRFALRELPNTPPSLCRPTSSSHACASICARTTSSFSASPSTWCSAGVLARQPIAHTEGIGPGPQVHEHLGRVAVSGALLQRAHRPLALHGAVSLLLAVSAWARTVTRRVCASRPCPFLRPCPNPAPVP